MEKEIFGWQGGNGLEVARGFGVCYLLLWKVLAVAKKTWCGVGNLDGSAGTAGEEL